MLCARSLRDKFRLRILADRIEISRSGNVSGSVGHLLKDSTIALYGAIVSAVAITGLFFGQRIAKDYAGAAVLVPYFLLALVAIYLLAQG